MDLIRSWLEATFVALSSGFARILWNLLLAYIPVFLSIWLFRWSNRRSLVWWVILATFIAFLPNAPYVLTDIIHYIRSIRGGLSNSVIIFALTPQYLIFLIGGLEAYVMSLLNLEFYLTKVGQEKSIFAVQMLIHFLSAIGIYLGRFLRFNSWDFVTQPDELAETLAQDLSHRQPVLAIAITFIILCVLYWITKQINLGLVLRFQQLQKEWDKNY